MSFLADYNQDLQFPKFRLSPPAIEQLTKRWSREDLSERTGTLVLFVTASE